MRNRFSLIVMVVVALAALLSAAPSQAVDVPTGLDNASQPGGDSPRTYEDELLGLTVELPTGWDVVSGGQEFDLAFVSPEALAGEPGAFITLQNIPGLGPDATLESALEPLAGQVNSSVEPLTAGANEGFHVQFADGNGNTQYLILFPYGNTGEVFYIQALAPNGTDSTILGILDSLRMEPPQPDYEAINAAWQASVADSGRMIYGDPDAPIQIVEFYSFTCPHCANYSYPMNRLIALDVESGRAQIELVPIAGDELADRATRAAFCAAEQGAGYSAYKALFSGSINLGREYAYSEEGIAEILSGLDVAIDPDALETCMASDRYTAAMDEARVRFTDYGLTGTPTVLLGANGDDVQPLLLPDGRVWSGSIPVEILRTIFTLITEEGVAVEDVVSHLMQ